jgi:hypothetical protein
LRDGAKTAAKINVQAVMESDEFRHFPGAVWHFMLLVLAPRERRNGRRLACRNKTCKDGDTCVDALFALGPQFGLTLSRSSARDLMVRELDGVGDR